MMEPIGFLRGSAPFTSQIIPHVGSVCDPLRLTLNPRPLPPPPPLSRASIPSEMWGHSPPALLSLLGLMMFWPYVLTTTVSSRPHTTENVTVSADSKQRPPVGKRSTESCDSTFDNYCLNQGQCMLLVAINAHHCKCERGYYGPRCAKVELVYQPMAEEHIIVTVFCVCLLLIGLAGALYFCCTRYKKKRLLASQPASGSSRDCLPCLPLTHAPLERKSNQEFPVS